MDPPRDLNQNSLRTAISCYLLLFSMLRNRMNPAQVLLPQLPWVDKSTLGPARPRPRPAAWR